jgi:hypothetical protein
VDADQKDPYVLQSEVKKAIKIGQNEYGWCLNSLECLPSFTPQFKLALVRPMIAVLTTMALANSCIRYTIRAGQWNAVTNVPWFVCVCVCWNWK